MFSVENVSSQMMSVSYTDIMDQDSAGHPSESHEDTSQFTLTVDEATQLFSDAGVPRSRRTIARYCLSGHLRCIKVDTALAPIYLVSKDSVELRIKEMQQFVTTSRNMPQHDTTSPNMLRHDVTGHDMSRHDTSRHDNGEDDRKIETLESRVKELENENRDLQITNKAKDYALEREEQRTNSLIQQVSVFSTRVGELKQKLLQLGAPEQNRQENQPVEYPRQSETQEDSVSSPDPIRHEWQPHEQSSNEHHTP